LGAYFYGLVAKPWLAGCPTQRIGVYADGFFAFTKNG
jgi:hypothetical protein